MEADTTPGSWSGTSALVPRVEGRGRPAPALEATDGIEHRIVIVRAEMFAPQPQPEVSCEAARLVPGSGRIAWFAKILFLVQDRDGELRVVRP